MPELAVHVSSPEAAEAAVNAGANVVYLGGDCFTGKSNPVDPAWVSQFAAESASRRVRIAVLGTRIADERDLAEWRWLLRRLTGIRGLGVGVSTLGSLHVARELRFHEILADFSMNVTNSQAVDELSTQGATRVTGSVELDMPGLTSLLRGSRLPVEVIGQGPLPSMVMDHCLVAAATGHSPEDVCPMNCRKGEWALRDTAGEVHRVACDRRCRNHLYMARDVCVLPNLSLLAQAGASAIRIEAQFESAAAVKSLTGAYRRAIDGLEQGLPGPGLEDVEKLAKAVGRPMGDGPFMFGAVCESPCETEPLGSSGGQR